MRCDKRDRFNAVDLGLCGEDALGIWWSVHPAIVELRTPKVWRVLTAFMFGTEKPDLATWSAWECAALNTLCGARGGLRGKA